MRYPDPVPSDLVEASASGWIHISVCDPPSYKYPELLERAISTRKPYINSVLEHVEGRQFGFIGEQRINVLKLNLALDSSK